LTYAIVDNLVLMRPAYLRGLDVKNIGNTFLASILKQWWPPLGSKWWMTLISIFNGYLWGMILKSCLVCLLFKLLEFHY